VVSVQGLISKCGEFNNYFAGIKSKDLWNNISLRDIIKFDIFPLQNRELKRRGKYEIECLKNADFVIGRTSWDQSNVSDITGVNKYKKCNESLRESFYDKNWDLKKIEKYSIFISQASYPLKGFHKILPALDILKIKYPNIKVYVAGSNVVKEGEVSLKEKLKLTGYGKYLRKLIKKYKLKDNIVFTGLLNEKQMVDRLLKSHVFVQTSSIENSPNSLGEAMLLGMPCVASNVGGTSDMLRDKDEGFLYPFNDEKMLAKYITTIFEDDDLAVSLGNKAKQHAIRTHDRLKNTNCMVEIYKELIK
jgi:glycosyltransferase involved in cell wall biosynthesis